jgi:hypothetical protein
MQGRLTVTEGRGYPLTDRRTYLSFHNSSFTLRYLFHVNGKVGARRVHYAPGSHYSNENLRVFNE